MTEDETDEDEDEENPADYSAAEDEEDWEDD